MSQPSVQKIDGAWYWFDETWNRMPTAYATRAEALIAQNRYVDVELEGRVRDWHPKPGDYVWYSQPRIGISNWSPAQVVRQVKQADVHDWPNNDFYIRMLTGSQEPVPVHESDLSPIPDMEVIALAASDRWDIRL
jgi:hypothetical protein